VEADIYWAGTPHPEINKWSYLPPPPNLSRSARGFQHSFHFPGWDVESQITTSINATTRCLNKTNSVISITDRCHTESSRKKLHKVFMERPL